MKTKLVLLLLWQTANCGFFKKFLCIHKGKTANFYKVNGTEKTLIYNGASLDPNATTFFLVHGWTESHEYDEYKKMANELVKYGNTIVVDYYELGSLFYGCALKIIRTLGSFVARFIKRQTNGGYMNPSRIYLIGHSLGGQGVGVIGREVEQLTGTKIKRISALDPAGPLFAFGLLKLPGPGLKATDAETVDVLHTSAHRGSYAFYGTVDFYANCVRGIIDRQPGCKDVYCSHKKSKEYFLESINSCGFIAKQTGFKTGKVVYGFHMPLNATGMYIFKTNSKAPFAKNSPECP